MTADQQISDFVAHAPLQAWCALILIAAVCACGAVCLTAGLCIELTAGWHRNRRMGRRLRRARRSLSYARR